MIITIAEIAASYIDSILCINFITKFFGLTWKGNKCAFIAHLIYFAATIVTDYYLGDGFISGSSILFLVSLAYAVFISKNKLIKSVISVCIYKVTLITLSSMIFSVAVASGYNMSEVDTGADNNIRLMIIMIQKVALFAILMLVIRIMNHDDIYEIQNGFFAFTFFAVTVIGLNAVMKIMMNVSSEYRIQLLIISTTFVLADIIMYVLLGYVIRLQKNKYEVKKLNDKIKFEELKYNETIKIWDQVRRIRHELRNKMTVIAGLLEENEYDKCVEYTNESLNEINKTGKFIQTGNAVLDYLINSRLMTLQGVQIDISGSIGSLDDIKESDLASLVGNIVDNAIEAVAQLEEKHIELLFRKQNGSRMIICKNNISKSVLKNNKQLITTKKDVESHGFGHKIVKEIVEKYHGIVSYFEESDMFGVQIMLPIISEVNV